ncbi:MAG: hypothetical protein MUE91_10640 [Ignavibacteriaceae bacterium]|jgi:hypothetical protein|nr:hypothetical protein [Ignavibacteriaceae bacterium]
MKKIILIFVLLFSLEGLLNAQTYLRHNSVFLGAMAGVATVNLSGNDGQNPVSLAFGGSVGIPVPLIENLFIYARTSYISQSNFQSFYNTSYLNTNIQLSEDFVEVNSSFSQLIINGGLLYNFLVTEDFVLGVNGGMTFMVVNQEARLRTGRVISSVDNENIWGAFGGIIAEKRWDDSSFSTFAEAQYNYAQSDAEYRPSALSAMNYTFGVRYYLEGR